MEKIVESNEQYGIQYESYTNNGRGKKGFWKHIEMTSKTQLMDFRGLKYFFRMVALMEWPPDNSFFTNSTFLWEGFLFWEVAGQEAT